MLILDGSNVLFKAETFNTTLSNQLVNSIALRSFYCYFSRLKFDLYSAENWVFLVGRFVLGIRVRNTSNRENERNDFLFRDLPGISIRMQ